MCSLLCAIKIYTVNIRYKQTQYKQKFGIDRSCGGPVRSYGLIC